MCWLSYGVVGMALSGFLKILEGGSGELLDGICSWGIIIGSSNLWNISFFLIHEAWKPSLLSMLCRCDVLYCYFLVLLGLL